jgi:energy-coupling factor transporter transmembrane protein EcfT
MAMAPNDYRNRLRNHSVKANEDAWNQMSMLLDSAAKPEKDKRKKRFILFFLGSLLSLSITLFFIYGIGVDKSNTDKLTQSTAIEKTEANKLNNNTFLKKDDLTSTESTSASTLANQNNTQSNQETNNDQTSKDYHNNKQIEQNELINATSLKERKAITKNINIAKEKNSLGDNKIYNQNTIASSTKTLITSGNSVNYPSSINENDSGVKKENNVGLNTQKILTDNNKINSSLDTSDGNFQTESQTIFDTPDVSDPLSSDRNELSIASLQTLKALIPLTIEKSNTILTTPSIITNRVTRLFWTGEIGGSDLNGSRGAYVGGGVFWDVDKVLGLESTLSLFSTLGNNNSTNPSQSIHRELNLTLWAHLNLIRTSKHKFSLEFGPSVLTTWRKRNNDIEVNNEGLSFNLFAGASYTYFINKNKGIGIKLAGSRSQSSFASFRFLQKF